jgi:hypothetical protein
MAAAAARTEAAVAVRTEAAIAARIGPVGAVHIEAVGAVHIEADAAADIVAEVAADIEPQVAVRIEAVAAADIEEIGVVDIVAGIEGTERRAGRETEEGHTDRERRMPESGSQEERRRGADIAREARVEAAGDGLLVSSGPYVPLWFLEFRGKFMRMLFGNWLTKFQVNNIIKIKSVTKIVPIVPGVWAAFCGSPLSCLVHQNLQTPKIDNYPFWDQNLSIVFDVYLPKSSTDINESKHLSIIVINILFAAFALPPTDIRLLHGEVIPARKLRRAADSELARQVSPFCDEN